MCVCVYVIYRIQK